MNKKAIPLQFQAAYAKYEEARAAVQGFESENDELLEQWHRLRDAYNSALEEVKAAYKKHHTTIGKTYGDFSTKKRTEIDVVLLKQLVPELPNLFEEKTVLNRKTYDKAVSEGDISAEIVEEVEEELTPAVLCPKQK